MQEQPSSALIKALRKASYSMPDDGFWYEKDGMYMPNNTCSIAADCIAILIKEIDRLDKELQAERRKKKSLFSRLWP